MPRIERNIIQQTPEWFAAKIGKPSASNASKLITSTGEPSKSMKGYAKFLAKEIFTGKPANDWGGNSSTDYGNAMEDESRAAYELLTGHEVEQVAFIIDDGDRYLCSPDGLISNDGGFEAKNKPKLHLDTLLYWYKYKKLEPDYIPQLQMSLFISKRDWWDIYYYSPDLPSLKVRVEPDLKLHRTLGMQLAEVIHERDKIVKILEEF